MRFFCPTCQAKYDTKIISADMWSICKEHIVENLKEVQTQYTGEAGNLFNNLVRAINEDTLCKEVNGKRIPLKSAFALNLENMGSRLQNRRKKDDYTLLGEYTLTLEELLDIFSGYSADYGKELIPKAGWQVKVCSFPVQVHLNKQFILDYVSDHTNLPFPVDDTDTAEMLGFRHICPHCGRKLSRAAGTAEEIVVALAGGPRAGKTATMYAILNSLLSGKCPTIEVLRPNQDIIWQNILKELETYKKSRPVTKTHPDDNKIEVPSLSIPVFSSETHRQAILTLVDMAGEFWMGASGFSKEWYRSYAEAYRHIDVIWYMVTKSTVYLSDAPSIPESILKDIKKDTAEDEDTIKGCTPTRLSENLATLKTYLPKMPPIMVVLSKPDKQINDIEWEFVKEFNLFPSENVSNTNSREIGNVLKIEETSRQHAVYQELLIQHANDVRNYIGKINANYIRAIEGNFADRFYTSLSPYGIPAYDNNNREPIPYHELFPFIWTLAIHGFFNVVQEVKWNKKTWIGGWQGSEIVPESVQFIHDFDFAQLHGKTDPQKQQIQDRQKIHNAIRENLMMHKAYRRFLSLDHKRSFSDF